MNGHEWEHEVRGDYRSVIGIDMYAEHPDGDVQGTIVYVDDRGYHHSTLVQGEGGVDHSDVVYALDHYWSNDWDKVERYLRMWHGVVGFDRLDVDYGKYVFIVTEADLKHWGFKDLAEYQEFTGGKDPSAFILDDWRAWVEGQVFYVDIQQRVTTHHVTRTMDRMKIIAEYDTEDWKSVDTCHGFYGSDYAEEHALDKLNHYAPQN